MKKKIIKLVILILWITFMFFLSNQTGIASSKQSDKLVNISNKLLSVDKKVLVIIIRKAAHIVEYLILFVLIFINFYEYKKKNIYTFSLIFSLIYAIFDELHQTFIYERSGCITDVIIDFVGITLGLLIIKIFYRHDKNFKKMP